MLAHLARWASMALVLAAAMPVTSSSWLASGALQFPHVSALLSRLRSPCAFTLFAACGPFLWVMRVRRRRAMRRRTPQPPLHSGCGVSVEVRGRLSRKPRPRTAPRTAEARTNETKRNANPQL